MTTTTSPPASTTPAATPAPTPPPSDPAEPPKPSAHIAAPQHDIPEVVDPLLVQILSWPRRDGSFQELQFCKFLRETIDAMGYKREIMAKGCLAVTVARPRVSTIVEGTEVLTPAKPSTTLFSCHVDTIEGYDSVSTGEKWDVDLQKFVPKANPEGEVADIRKKLVYDTHFGEIALDKDSIGGSLGADDGAGVWLMLEMLKAKVPGTYVFHRSEEVGGLGSKEMALKHADWLEQFEAAVAFDRHDTYEIIHTQGGSKCASTKFTDALCKRLNEKGMRYEPSSRGVFTDTKNYRGLIPECVNVAVGYQGQHGRNETLDYAHLVALRDALVRIDWDSLPIDRDPKEKDTYSGGGYGRGRSWGNGFDFGGDEDDRSCMNRAPQFGGGPPKKKKRKQQQQAANQPTLTVSDELNQFALDELEAWAEKDPEGAAKAIGQLLVEVATLKSTVNISMNLLGWKEDK